MWQSCRGFGAFRDRSSGLWSSLTEESSACFRGQRSEVVGGLVRRRQRTRKPLLVLFLWWRDKRGTLLMPNRTTEVLLHWESAHIFPTCGRTRARSSDCRRGRPRCIGPRGRRRLTVAAPLLLLQKSPPKEPPRYRRAGCGNELQRNTSRFFFRLYWTWEEGMGGWNHWLLGKVSDKCMRLNNV